MKILLPSFAGLALFLYGMTLMGNALQKVAGNRMRSIIGSLTRNTIMQVLVGIVVTAIIQSSSATTAMIIGFVNANLMTLTQSVGVIIGANLGTTITGQISAFEITNIAFVVIFIGVLLWLFAKDQKAKDKWEVFIGFGILFLGMDLMSEGLKPLTTEPWFENAILSLNTPIIGVITGSVLTAISQSSSAVIGILQALARANLITIHQAFPVLLGSNIGTTATGMISSIGANRNGKRVALIHFLFNTIGTVIFLLFLMGPIEHLAVLSAPDAIPRQIANSHTLFNLIMVLISLPFTKVFVKIANLVIPGEDEDTLPLIQFDERFLETPSIGIVKARDEVVKLAEIVYENFLNLQEYFESADDEYIEKIYETEKYINDFEKELIVYLVKLSNSNISDDQHTDIFIMQHTLNDLERIGDHVINIIKLLEELNSEELVLSDIAVKEYHHMSRLIKEIILKTIQAYDEWDENLAQEVLVLENEINDLTEEYRISHIRRINNRTCVPAAGVLFLDILANYERMADHCVNLSDYILGKSI